MIEEEAKTALSDNEYNMKYGANVNSSKNPQANPITDYISTNGNAVSADQNWEHLKWSMNQVNFGR